MIHDMFWGDFVFSVIIIFLLAGTLYMTWSSELDETANNLSEKEKEFKNTVGEKNYNRYHQRKNGYMNLVEDLVKIKKELAYLKEKQNE